MLENLSRTAGTSKSKIWVFREQLPDDVSAVIGVLYPHLVRHLHVLTNDLLIHPLHISLIERVRAYKHFVHDDANCPPVNREGVPTLFDLLWSKICRRAD